MYTKGNLNKGVLIMRTLTKTELENILELHKKWLLDFDKGIEPNRGVKANLSGFDLSCMNLDSVDLSMADLSKSNLSKCDLNHANLYGADLHETNLSNAGLYSANLNYTRLYNSNLSCSNLCAADLFSSNLHDADLSKTTLSSAILSNTNLTRANLSNSDLHDANLRRANLNHANLQSAKLNWVNWDQVIGIKVYMTALQFRGQNRQLTYIPSLDIATIESAQYNWTDTKKHIYDGYSKDTKEYKIYDLAIKYIEGQIELDSYEE